MKIKNILGVTLCTCLLLSSCSKDDEPTTPPSNNGGGNEQPSNPGTTTNPEVPTPDPNSRLLYNGITLPPLWPPSTSTAMVTSGMTPGYLYSKPSVIDITIGRQLFVDNFLISQTTLKRNWHRAEYHPSSPVLVPEKEWELDGKGGGSAAPFSDGVWYDETDNKFKMWYMAAGGTYGGGNMVTCYAESTDGINWTRPSLNVTAGTNIVHSGKNRDSNTVWLDKNATNQYERYKMFQSSDGAGNWKYHYYTSSDGKAWREVNESKAIADRSTVFKNPFRGVWVWSLRHNVRVNAATLVRGRDSMENADPTAGNKVAEADLQRFWFGAWPSEPKHPVYTDVQPAIYNLDAIGYESVMLGIFSVWSGPENDVCSADGVIKRNQLLLGYSRDGWNWYREDFVPFCPVSEDKSAWNNGNIQSAVGSPIIVGDKLYFYMSGRHFSSNGREIVSTGLATLRRDGFASMSGTGELITEPLKFSGEYFFVNAAINGSLAVEIQDEKGNPISGFTQNDCVSVSGDGTCKQVKWKNNDTLASLKGKTIRIKFVVKDGDLYAFWVTPFAKGNSFGYTAGGGPGLYKLGIDAPY